MAPEAQPLKSPALIDEVQKADEAKLLITVPSLELVLVSAVSAGSGLILSILVGWFDILADERSMLNGIGVPFASGQPFHPLTVSEHATNPGERSAALIFNALNNLAALFLMLSFYPYYLHNVHVEEVALGGVRWVTLRQWSAIGLFVLATFWAVPSEAAQGDVLTTNLLHLVGAVVVFIGTILSEGHALFFTSSLKHLSSQELWSRRLAWAGLTACAVVTVAMQVVYPLFPDEVLCCGDLYERVTEEDLKRILSNSTNSLTEKEFARKAFLDGAPVIINTAYGAKAAYKAVTFWSEVLAVMFVILDLLLIWYWHRRARIPTEFVRDVPRMGP